MILNRSFLTTTGLELTTPCPISDMRWERGCAKYAYQHPFLKSILPKWNAGVPQFLITSELVNYFWSCSTYVISCDSVSSKSQNPYNSMTLCNGKKTYIPGSHPANSIVLQALILLSQCNPMAHGWTIYLSWLQTRNELQSDGFGAKPPKAEQAWPRKTNKTLKWADALTSTVLAVKCEKKILKNNQHIFFCLHPTVA